MESGFRSSIRDTNASYRNNPLDGWDLPRRGCTSLPHPPPPRHRLRSRPPKEEYMPDEKINVAIIGVGNCASSLVQGVEYYKNAEAGDVIPGLMHPVLAGYHIRDINFVAAFDVDADKVGNDLNEAIFSGQNHTFKFTGVPETGVTVSRGMTNDGIGKYLSQVVTKAPGETADIVKILKETNPPVVINYLPVGSEEATKWYVEQVLQAGCAFINCIPVFIAKENYWATRFEE